MVLSKLLGVRLEQNDADRVDAIRAKLSELPGITTSISDVIRACVLAGLPVVEKRVLGVTGAKSRKGKR